MMKNIFILPIAFCFLGIEAYSFAQLVLGKGDEFSRLPKKKMQNYLSEKQAKFRRMEGSYVWISDIEHVMEKKTGEIFLADAKKRYYLCGDIIPGGKLFELFPYHYYGADEEKKLGKRINYKLVIKNILSADVVVEIMGMGTTTDWDHYKTWEGALRGDNKKIIKLKPKEIYTLWEEKGLIGDLPWSGIILGKASGDIWVCDYAYVGEIDPGVEQAEQMPDLTWEPYLQPSFTRGTSDWNSATIDLFPQERDEKNRLKLSLLKDEVYSIVFGYSPGGPINNLCEYKAVEPTFAEDKLMVKDPVSQKGHLFFGGNYPIMYKFSLPIINDTQTSKTINLYLCSNDKFNVDTIAGVWIEKQLLWCRMPAVIKELHWKVFSLTLKPSEERQLDFIIVPLGSRWGGIIASLELSSI